MTSIYHRFKLLWLSASILFAFSCIILFFFQMSSHISAEGKFTSQHEFSVFAPWTAKVKSILVETGQYVKKGEVIAVLEDTDLKADITSLKAKIAEAEANYAFEEHQFNLLKINPLPKEFWVTDHKLKNKETEFQYQQEFVHQLEKLLKNNNISKEDYLEAKRKSLSTQSEYKTLEYKKKVLDAGLIPATLQAKQSYLNWLHVKLDNMKVHLKHKKDKLKKKIIQSPINGVVAACSLQPGQWIKKGAIMGTIANDQQKKVILWVQENDIQNVKPHQKVLVKSLHYQNYDEGDLEAEVTKVYPKSEQRFNKTVYRVECSVPEQQWKVKLGSNVDAQIFTKHSNPLHRLLFSKL